ncbi:uncharacterized protein LOC100213006 isoform X2 [Hydra vulgaris]|uniref:uncharacterized protein LOC100213006 isoform X2 n=1 Tax=Hydra vulgaris TaxID=6087 RepID=UPI001F5FB623|nr:uncharacterized protein LOC100213006 isoform X2 [Hydra vulgaris]
MADVKEEVYEHENVQYQDEAAKNSQISLQTDVFINEQSSRMQEILFQASDSDENVVLTTNDGENIVLYVEEGTHVAGFQDLIRVALDQSMSSSNQASINNELKFESIQKEQQQSLDLPVIIDCSQVLTGDELTIDVSEKLNESSESSKFLDRSSTEMDNLFQLAKLSGGISLQCGKELERTLQGVEGQRVKSTNVDIDPNDLVSEFTIENEENEAKVVPGTEIGEFNIGDSFYSLEEVEESLRIYEEKHNVKLYKRDVRSLDALLKRSLKLQKLDKVNKSLKYGQLLYCCVYGGKRKAQKIACIDASGVARFTDCRMFIRFAISDDGMTLVVNGKLEEHCHDEIVSHSFEPEEPLYETNSGNAEEIRLGAGYTDLEELYKAIYKYETDNHVHLWRRDGRTIEALAKRAPGTAKKIMETNPGLRFAELRFCCSYGGRQISDEKKEKLMGSSSSFKVGCEMHIRFGVSDDGSQLIVKSMSEDHNHEINEEAVVKEALHPELCSHVSKLVWNDPSIPIDEVKRLLELYVVKEMFKDQVPPPRTRRQYFPTKKQIRYFMSKARSSLNISHDVEQKLEAQAEVLKEKHNDEKMIFNFKVKHDASLESTVQNDDSVEASEDFISDEKDLKNELNENAKLLFCHQTPHQQRLLKRYNSQIILTQIKDIHARIPFPLYCIYVQTNVDYQLVAEFILQTNTVAMLSEGLQTIKDWNPGWNPKFVVCDYSDVQIEAVEASFNGSFILISDSSREKAWKDWLSDDQNGVSEHQDEMLMHLKAIAQSFSEDTLNAAARELEESEVWKTSDKLRNWFQFNWLAHAKRWVSGYRPDDYLMTCHNNRTLEDELKVFRSIKLVNKTTPLQDVIQQLVEHVVPVACKQYYDLNKESIKLHNDLRYAYSNIPNYLCARPGLITYHIYERLKKANEQSFTIRCMHSGIFTVQGDTNEEDHLHTVSFGDANCFPSCDCEDWLRFKLPCEHFCAIYNNFPGWNWDMMSNLYKFLPQLNIDWGCETNINIDMPGLFVDNSTQTSPVKDMVGGEHNLFFGVTDKRTSHETPQVLASQCRGLLQQLSKLQLAHHSRENLYRLKTELKELIAIFSNAANKDKQPIVNSGSIENSSVQLKSLGRPRKNASAPSIALNHDLSITKEDAQSHVRPLQTRKTYPQRHQEVDKVNAIGVATVFKNIRQSAKNETVKIVSQKRSISDSHDECPAKLSKEDNCVKEEDGDFDLQGIGPPSIETSCLTTIIDGKTIEIPLENIRTAIGTSNSLNISQTVLASEELISEDDAVK